MTGEQILARLDAMQDTGYRDFQAKLIPTVAPQAIIGIRTPQLRQFAKELCQSGGTAEFLHSLPHAYFDENQLHAFIISQQKDIAECIAQVERFLPFVDNWATCDQLLPVAFRKNPEPLLPHIRRWLRSQHTYTVRFAIGMLMQHFLDDRFDAEYPALVAAVPYGDYYVNMMVAWYFATALAKQYDAVVPFIEQRRLPAWTHDKAIQKATESRRITQEQKAYLRTLKVGSKGSAKGVPTPPAKTSPRP